MMEYFHIEHYALKMRLSRVYLEAFYIPQRISVEGKTGMAERVVGHGQKMKDSRIVFDFSRPAVNQVAHNGSR